MYVAIGLFSAAVVNWLMEETNWTDILFICAVWILIYPLVPVTDELTRYLVGINPSLERTETLVGHGLDSFARIFRVSLPVVVGLCLGYQVLK